MPCFGNRHVCHVCRFKKNYSKCIANLKNKTGKTLASLPHVKVCTSNRSEISTCICIICAPTLCVLSSFRKKEIKANKKKISRRRISLLFRAQPFIKSDITFFLPYVFHIYFEGTLYGLMMKLVRWHGKSELYFALRFKRKHSFLVILQADCGLNSQSTRLMGLTAHHVASLNLRIRTTMKCFFFAV